MVVLCPSITPTFYAQNCAQLFITEIMYDPASSNTTIWEYVEIYNADTVAFDLTGTVLDDMAGSILSSPNVGNQVIPPLTAAVLFNDDNTEEAFKSAWGDTVLFVPVSNWGILNNGGDRVALWCSIEAYSNRDFSTAITSVHYDGGGLWPVHDGIGSIELSCPIPAICDLNEAHNWHLNNGATFSNPVGENMIVNHGSPGIFPNPEPLFSVIANRFEFIPSPPDSGEVEVDFEIRICASDGTDIQTDYEQLITLNDDFSTANYTIESSQTISPIEGCATYNITPHSTGEIRVIIGNDDFERLPATIAIEATSTSIHKAAKPQMYQIFPTIASDFILIKMTDIQTDNGAFTVFNIEGQIVQIHQIEMGISQKLLDISQLSSGIYFIQKGGKTARFMKH